MVSLRSRKKTAKIYGQFFWQFHIIVRKEPLRVKLPTLKLNLFWSVKFSQRHSNTFFRYLRKLTVEWLQGLRHIMDYIYKIELNLSNIADGRQLSKWLQ